MLRVPLATCCLHVRNAVEQAMMECECVGEQFRCSVSNSRPEGGVLDMTLCRRTACRLYRTMHTILAIPSTFRYNPLLTYKIHPQPHVGSQHHFDKLALLLVVRGEGLTGERLMESASRLRVVFLVPHSSFASKSCGDLISLCFFAIACSL